MFWWCSQFGRQNNGECSQNFPNIKSEFALTTGTAHTDPHCRNPGKTLGLFGLETVGKQEIDTGRAEIQSGNVGISSQHLSVSNNGRGKNCLSNGSTSTNERTLNRPSQGEYNHRLNNEKISYRLNNEKIRHR